jgi:hypothetical protein
MRRIKKRFTSMLVLGTSPNQDKKNLGVAPLRGAGLLADSAIRLGAGPPYSPPARVGRHCSLEHHSSPPNAGQKTVATIVKVGSRMDDNCFTPLMVGRMIERCKQNLYKLLLTDGKTSSTPRQVGPAPVPAQQEGRKAPLERRAA